MNDRPTFPQERYYVEKASGSDRAYVIDRKTGRSLARFSVLKSYGQMDGWEAARYRADWMNRRAAADSQQSTT